MLLLFSFTFSTATGDVSSDKITLSTLKKFGIGSEISTYLFSLESTLEGSAFKLDFRAVILILVTAFIAFPAEKK